MTLCAISLDFALFAEMFLQRRSAFNADSLQLGVCGDDGAFTTFNTRTGLAQNRFVPSSHLSASCSCLAWKPKSPFKETPSKEKTTSRKRKTSTSSGNGDFNEDTSGFVALGTGLGTVIAYDVTSGAAKEQKIHSASVNDIAWHLSEPNVIYSVSDDGTIGKWNSKARGQSSTFTPEAKKAKLYSLSMHPSGNSILVGTMAKVLWIDVDTKAILRTFNAHKGQVSILKVFTMESEVFFASAGSNERDLSLSIWPLKAEESEQSQPVVMLDTNEIIGSVNISDQGPNLIGCVTESGIFHCFELDLAKKKVQKPKATIRISTEKDKQGHVVPIPIMSCHINNGKIQLAHGTYAKPAFESLEYEVLNKENCLIRSVNTEPIAKDFGVKHVVGDVSGTTVLAPGVSMTVEHQRKRKASLSEKTEELPMLERLRLLSKADEDTSTPPRTDSLLQLLMQVMHCVPEVNSGPLSLDYRVSQS